MHINFAVGWDRTKKTQRKGREEISLAKRKNTYSDSGCKGAQNSAVLNSWCWGPGVSGEEVKGKRI